MHENTPACRELIILFGVSNRVRVFILSCEAVMLALSFIGFSLTHGPARRGFEPRLIPSLLHDSEPFGYIDTNRPHTTEERAGDAIEERTRTRRLYRERFARFRAR